MAFFKGSAYEFTPIFEPTDDGGDVFRGLRARRIRRPVPILEHTVALKERLDSLAQHYYGDSRSWYRIVEANPDVVFPEDLLFEPLPVEENGRERLGAVILIPRRREPR